MREHVDTAFTHRRHRFASGVCAHVDDRLDADSCLDQIESGTIGAVIVDVERGPVARLGAIAVDISLRRAGQHDARAVIVGEHHRPLDGAGGEHHLGRADFPQALAEGSGRRAQMVIHALDHEHVILVVIAERGGAGEHPHFCHVIQFGAGTQRPIDA